MKPHALNATRFQCLRGRSWFAESKYVAMSLIDNFIYWIVFFTGVGCGVDGRDPSRLEASRGIIWRVGSLSRSDHRTADGIRRRTPIVARSWPDRGAIGARSCHDWTSFRLGIILNWEDGGWPRSKSTIDAQSWLDRGPIVPWSELVLKRNWSQFCAESKQHPRPKEPLPRRLQTMPTTASNGHDFGPNFPL